MTTDPDALVTIEVTLPKWLADLADQRGLDLSQILIDALRAKLGV